MCEVFCSLHVPKHVHYLVHTAPHPSYFCRLPEALCMIPSHPAFLIFARPYKDRRGRMNISDLLSAWLFFKCQISLPASYCILNIISHMYLIFVIAPVGFCASGFLDVSRVSQMSLASCLGDM